MKRAVSILAVACLIASARGAEPQIVRLSLAEAIERARTNSPRLEQLSFLAEAADSGLAAARAGRMPEVDLTAGYTRNSNVPELTIAFPGQPARTIFPNLPNNSRARLSISWPFYTGGRVESLIAVAEKNRSAARSDRESSVADLTLETSAAYWSLVASREAERVLGEAVASYDAHLKQTNDRAEAGLAARNEVLAVQVERDRAVLSKLQAANGATVANANLLRLLGLPAETVVETTEPLEPPETGEENTEALFTAAKAARRDRAALEERIAAAEASAQAERAGWRPQIAASAGYDVANPNRKILPPEQEWKSTWDAGVSLSFTIFDGGRTAAAVRQAGFEAAALRKQLEEMDRGIRLDVTERAADLATARAGLEVAGKNIDAGRENLRVSFDRYHEGVIPSSELLDAETALLRAGLDRTEAYTRLRLAAASLERAVGR